MGLDMYLYRQKKLRENDDAYNELAKKTSKQIMYWRKANQIRSWIINNTSYEDDWNCEVVELSKETLEKLVSDCEIVLNNHDKAKELFPVSIKFFFGSISYDEHYYKQLKYTMQEIKKILEETDFETESIIYTEWW